MTNVTNIAAKAGKTDNQLEYTPVKNGLRQRRSNGVWYVFQKIDGRLHRDCLDTIDEDEAEVKRDALVAEVKKAKAQGVDLKNKETFGEYEKAYRAQLEYRVKLGPAHEEGITDSTADTYRQGLDRWLKLWPGAESVLIREITSEKVTNKLEPLRSELSRTQFNRLHIALTGVFEIALKKKAILVSPLEIKRSSKQSDETYIPDREEWTRFINYIRNAPNYANAWKVQIVDFLEGLCVTGLRLDEANHVKKEHVKIWTDADGQKRGTLRVVKSKTKKGYRIIDLIPVAISHLEYLIATYPGVSLFPIKECYKTFTYVCGEKGLNLRREVTRDGKQVIEPLRFTHHTCRHIFATYCLEAGIEPKVAASWLGHSDGGSLFLKTYSHLLRDFLQAQAAKVTNVTLSRVSKPVVVAKSAGPDIAALHAKLAELQKQIEAATKGTNIVSLPVAQVA